MSSATPMPYEVRYDANLGTIVYAFQTGWLPIPAEIQSFDEIIGTGNPTIIKPLVDSTHAFWFTNANQSTVLLTLDTQDARVGIGTSTPPSGYLLTVAGNANIFGTVNVGSGLLLPQFTSATIGTLPVTKGYTVYNTDTSQIEVADGTAFEPVGSTSPNVVQTIVTTTDFFTTASATFVDSGFGVTITPSSTGAKILLTFSFSNDMNGSGTAKFTIFRGIGGTNLGGGTSDAFVTTPANFGSAAEQVSISFLDTPGTASPVTYELYAASIDGISILRLNDDGLTMVAIAQEVH